MADAVAVVGAAAVTGATGVLSHWVTGRLAQRDADRALIAERVRRLPDILDEAGQALTRVSFLWQAVAIFWERGDVTSTASREAMGTLEKHLKDAWLLENTIAVRIGQGKQVGQAYLKALHEGLIPLFQVLRRVQMREQITQGDRDDADRFIGTLYPDIQREFFDAANALVGIPPELAVQPPPSS